MPSQPGQQKFTTDILPDISRSKGNQTMKLGRLIEYNKMNIFFKSHAENEAERLLKDLFLFFEKALFEVKATWHTTRKLYALFIHICMYVCIYTQIYQ